MEYDSEKHQLLLKVKELYKNQISKKIDSDKKIKYAGPVYDEREMLNAFECLTDAFYSGWFSLGKYSQKFTEKLSTILGIDNIVLTNSGSSANLLAVASLSSLGRIKRGDEVITLAATFPTTINPLLLYGLKPVLVDIELPSYTINIDMLESAISNKTKLIMIPHINGSPNDMRTIMEIAEKHDISVIEDTCDALGSRYDGKFTGTFGDISTFSFYGAHHISTGEGGAVASSNKEIAETVTSIRDWGRATVSDYDTKKGRKLEFQKVSKSMPEDYEARYTYTNIGYNLKPLDIQLAMGLPQLDKMEAFSKIRKSNYSEYMKGLKEYSDRLILPEALPKADPSWFVFPIIIEENAGFKRGDLVRYLEEKGIETRPILAGNVHKQPAYQNVRFKVAGKLKNSDLILNRGLFLGVYQGLNRAKVQYVIDSVSSFMESIK